MDVLSKCDVDDLDRLLPQIIREGQFLLSLEAIPYLGKSGTVDNADSLAEIIKTDKRPKVVRFAVIVGSDIDYDVRGRVVDAVKARIKMAESGKNPDPTMVAMLRRVSAQNGLLISGKK